MLKAAIGLVSGLVFVGTSAMADTYRCEVVGASDYSVEINMKSKQAGFFDNDSWSIVPFVNDDFFAYEIQFKGQDNYGDLLTISFDYSGMISPPQHQIEYVAENEIQRARLTCSPISKSQLRSGI